jgi:hypothetical protein
MKGHKMRFLVIAVFAAGPAAADPGHLAGLAGHDHWIAGIAIGAAIAAGLWGALKGKPEDEADGEEPEAQEA